MLSEKMEAALNEQIKWEFYSAYLYLSMAAYFEDLGLEGFSHWMKAQAAEETMHAMKFYRFVHERGGRVRLQEIPKPPEEWDSPLACLEYALNHEQEVSRRINALMSAAKEEGDHATEIFLQWFVSEQVEEEDSFGRLVNQMKLVKDSPQGLFHLDRELATRPLDLNLMAQEA
ncbi:ferritin [Thermosulfurimonas sp.]|uniref:ferritin n=1 Tax=Thermosulfurimonas sp. TaxID=2080236 RepID=UPI0025E082EF|nr:ferritin [Thermosulfurimonas sp.]